METPMETQRKGCKGRRKGRKGKNLMDPYMCHKCFVQKGENVTFKRKRDRDSHLKEHRRKPPQLKEPKPPPTCDICRQIFSRERDVKRHKDTVHKGNRLQCTVPGCSITLSRKDKLVAHINKIHG